MKAIINFVCFLQLVINCSLACDHWELTSRNGSLSEYFDENSWLDLLNIFDGSESMIQPTQAQLAAEQGVIDDFDEIDFTSFRPFLTEDECGRTVLHTSLMNGDCVTFRKKIKEMSGDCFFSEMLLQDQDGKTPRDYAAERGLSWLHLLVLKEDAALIASTFLALVEHAGSYQAAVKSWGRALLKQDSACRTAWHYAVFCGDIRVMHCLLINTSYDDIVRISSLKDLSLKSYLDYALAYNGWNAAHLIAMISNVQNVKDICNILLFSGGYGLFFQHDHRGRTPLMIASELRNQAAHEIITITMQTRKYQF